MTGIPDTSAGGTSKELAPGVFVPARGIKFVCSRSGGPGGQNVNKLNTRVEMWVDPSSISGLSENAVERLRKLAGRQLTRQGLIRIVAEQGRTQQANRRSALQKLGELLIRAMYQPKRRRRTNPTAASRLRRLEGKRHRALAKASRRSSPSAET